MIPAVDIACLALGAAGAGIGTVASIGFVRVVRDHDEARGLLLRTVDALKGQTRWTDVWRDQALAFAREIDRRIAKDEADKALRKASARHARACQIDQERARKAETTAKLRGGK